MSAGPRVDEARLRRIFGRALWLALAAPAIPLACGSSAGSSSGDSGTSAASTSATTSTSASGGGADGAGGGQAGGGGGGGSAPSDFPPGCGPVDYTPDPPDPCGEYVRLPCGVPPTMQTEGVGCYFLHDDCTKLCPSLNFNCHAADAYCTGDVLTPDADGGVVVDCAICAGGAGRVPAGLSPARPHPARSALGAYFASAAHLEAASVHAFTRLGDELAAHGAPARLVRAAARAARDERRHARATARLSRRFGGRPVPPRVARLATRPLDAIAAENAVEGCVRETFAALVATYQAAHASDPEIAQTMARIARDETRHAALSWAVARWAARRLDAPARAALARAQDEAVASLRRSIDVDFDDALAGAAGLPRAYERGALLDALERELWRPERHEA